MKMNKWFMALLVLSFLATLPVIPMLPAQIPTHWNIQGEVDNMGSKYVAILTGALPVLIYGLLTVIPRIDPGRANYEIHKKAYSVLRVGISLFLVFIHWIAMAYALGVGVSISFLVPTGVGILFMIIGNFMTQIRHNYFFGIRLPWTLADEVVWRKTHRLGGYMFTAAGILTVISGFISPSLTFVVLMGSVTVIVLGTALYSYLVYRGRHPYNEGR